jgi:hypothetical protein
MLRLSKLTDYAVAVLSCLSHETGVQTTPDIAATTSKVKVGAVLKNVRLHGGGDCRAKRR